MVHLALALVSTLLLHLTTTQPAAPIQETKSARIGGFVALRCGFSDVQWFKYVEGAPVSVEKLGVRRIIVISDGTMYVSRLKETDDGMYLCSKHDTPIKLFTVKIASKPKIVVAPSDVTTRPGSLVHFACEGEGSPTPTLEWRVGRVGLRNLPILPSNSTMEQIMNYKGDDYVVTENGHLYVRNVTPQHSALYVCLYTNSGGSSFASANLLVLDPPEITTRPADTSALDADIIGFACRAVGNPLPVITWKIETFEGVTIENPANDPSDRYEVDRYRTLRIRFPVPSDSGRYTCIATNNGGSTNATGILQVLITPQFRVPPKDSWVPVGSSAVFSCTVFGSPTPLIEWFKDNTYLPFSNTYQIQHVTRPNEVQERLVFRQVRFEDTGFYECRASNLAGTSRYEFSMAVTEAMPFPGDRFVQDALDYAHNFVQSAIQETQVVLKSQFNNPNFQPTPQDLFHLVRQPTRQTLYMAMSAEVFEHALDYIHQQIEQLNHTSLERNQQPLASLLSPAALDHLEDLSGCRARSRQPNCQMRCQLMTFRSHDGSCNNVHTPLYGSSLYSLNRFLPALYENKYNTPRGWSHTLPSARLVSQRLIRTDVFGMHSDYSTVMLHFGQFIAHDLVQTVAGPSETTFAPFLRVRCRQTCSNTMPCFPIEIATNDTRIDAQCMPFVRSAATCGTGDTSVFGKEVRVREQLNQVTSFIDASTVYGSADVEMETLRDRTAGKGQLRVGEESVPGKHFLPREDVLVPEELESERRCIGRAATVFFDCFLAGDRRSTEQPGLTALHTLWMRQHNNLAYKLSEVNPQWNDDRIYEEARKIVGAQMQHITFNEYVPKVLGTQSMELLGKYMGYDSEMNPSILNEFATAAFRFGHTLIPPTLFRRGENYEEFELGDMPLHNSFFTPYRVLDEGGIDPILRGMIMQNLKRPDGHLSKAVTERLFHIIAQVSLDLAAINIQRGRDHAIPTYNDMRQVCGMRRALNFHDLQSEISNATTRQILSELYNSVDDVDLWVGGLEEDALEGGLVGPTFGCIIAEQFKRVRDGDRFWYEADKHFTPEQLRQIKKTTMAKIFCENSDNITKVPEDVYMYNPDAHKYTDCDSLPRFDFAAFIDCGGSDYLRYQSHLYDTTLAPNTLYTGTNSISNGPRTGGAGSQGTDGAAGTGPTADPGTGPTADPGTADTAVVTGNDPGTTMAPKKAVVTGKQMTEQPQSDMKPMSIREEMDRMLNNLDSMNSQVQDINHNIDMFRSQVSKLEERMLVEGGCQVDDMVYEQGESWTGDECTTCVCQGGMVSCDQDPGCAKLTLK